MAPRILSIPCGLDTICCSIHDIRIKNNVNRERCSVHFVCTVLRVGQMKCCVFHWPQWWISSGGTIEECGLTSLFVDIDAHKAPKMQNNNTAKIKCGSNSSPKVANTTRVFLNVIRCGHGNRARGTGRHATERNAFSVQRLSTGMRSHCSTNVACLKMYVILQLY